ncbi:MAG: hypothetical protein JWL90_1331 [Chthoniobacteraceae bacterium]|nr:hypothetical protein [Chthoniobacteraceae bacterium]
MRHIFRAKLRSVHPIKRHDDLPERLSRNRLACVLRESKKQLKTQRPGSSNDIDLSGRPEIGLMIFKNARIDFQKPCLFICTQTDRLLRVVTGRILHFRGQDHAGCCGKAICQSAFAAGPKRKRPHPSSQSGAAPVGRNEIVREMNNDPVSGQDGRMITHRGELAFASYENNLIKHRRPELKPARERFPRLHFAFFAKLRPQFFISSLKKRIVN